MKAYIALVLVTALATLMPQRVSAIDSPTTHVTVLATLGCKDFAIPEKPEVVLRLWDEVVTGREYYPSAQLVSITSNQLKFSFEAPYGVYYVSARLKPEPKDPDHDCSWSGSLMTLPGIDKSLTVTFQSMIAHLWDTSDFAAGTIAGNATVTWEKLSRNRDCGKQWTPSREIDSRERQSGAYYVQFPWLNPSKEIPALVVSDGAHITVVALAPIETTPLQEHHYLRRDISSADLLHWSALPSGTIVCDPPGVPPSPTETPMKPLQRVFVTAFIQCSDENELYASETPSVELEDQLHRGQFIFPHVTITRHVGNQVVLEFAISPGAYDLGMRLPRPDRGRDLVLPCYSANRFAVLPTHDRHLTFLICTCGDSGSDRALVAGRLEPSSMSVSVTMIPRSVSCNSEIGDMTAAFQERTVAVLDDGYYYARYSPYDPTKQPVLVISGTGLSEFVAIDSDGTQSSTRESVARLDITNAKLQKCTANSVGGSFSANKHRCLAS
jgi:hypothetical protein